MAAAYPCSELQIATLGSLGCWFGGVCIDADHRNGMLLWVLCIHACTHGAPVLHNMESEPFAGGTEIGTDSDRVISNT